ncbi:hypothetical protein D7X88_02220 [bacterium C-53]|nr:hypothetical protein [Lachnospiraceae bacterium]RKJ12247.1 hypothetical protein D7X88_02220 [bacterium C-53]
MQRYIIARRLLACFCFRLYLLREILFGGIAPGLISGDLTTSHNSSCSFCRTVFCKIIPRFIYDLFAVGSL